MEERGEPMRRGYSVCLVFGLLLAGPYCLAIVLQTPVQTAVAAQPSANIQPVSSIKIGPFFLDRTVKAADFLTPITVFISMLTFVWTLRKDIEARRSTEATKIRESAAAALGKLERWKELALWYYQEIQPSFIETSESLAQHFDVAAARDSLWKALQAFRVKTKERLLSESLETTYTELSSYYPDIYDAFSRLVVTMREIEEMASTELLERSQSVVLTFAERQQGYTPPMLGNALRQLCGAVTMYLSDQLDSARKPVRDLLVELIKLDDEPLLNAKARGDLVLAPERPRYATLSEFIQAKGRAVAAGS